MSCSPRSDVKAPLVNLGWVRRSEWNIDPGCLRRTPIAMANASLQARTTRSMSSQQGAHMSRCESRSTLRPERPRPRPGTTCRRGEELYPALPGRTAVPDRTSLSSDGRAGSSSITQRPTSQPPSRRQSDAPDRGHPPVEADAGVSNQRGSSGLPNVPLNAGSSRCAWQRISAKCDRISIVGADVVNPDTGHELHGTIDRSPSSVVQARLVLNSPRPWHLAPNCATERRKRNCRTDNR